MPFILILLLLVFIKMIYSILIAVYALALHTAAAVWVNIERNGTSQVDAAKFLGCLRANGINASTPIYMDGNTNMIILFGGNLQNKPRVKYFLHRCQDEYSSNLAVVSSFTDIVESDDQYLGTIEEITEDWSLLPEVGRHRVISAMQVSSMLPASPRLRIEVVGRLRGLGFMQDDSQMFGLEEYI